MARQDIERDLHTSPSQEIIDFFETPTPPAVFAQFGPHGQVGADQWTQYRLVLGLPEIDLQTKELMGLAVAATKASDYMVGFQRWRLAALKVEAAEVSEALAVASFFEGLDAFAHALHVDSEIRPHRLQTGDLSLIDKELDVNVPYVMQSDDALVQGVYDQIRSTMGISFVPNIFKAMAHQPAALGAKWQSYRTTMLDGKLRRLTKELIAVAVSAVNACFY